MQTHKKFNQTVTNHRLTEHTTVFDLVQQFFINPDRIIQRVSCRNDNLAGFFIHNVPVQKQALQTTTPADFFRQLIASDGCQIVTLGVEKQRFHKLGCILNRRRFSRTKTFIYFQQSGFPVNGIILAAFECCPDAGIIIEQCHDGLIRFPTQRPDQNSHRQFAGTVDTN